jgi:carbamoyltransferase
MIILGLGGILSDPACALLRDGELVAAVEEKKVSRRFDAGELPAHATDAALKIAGVTAEQVEAVALVRPFSAGADSSLHLQVRERFPNARLVLVEHHVAHAASAWYPSGFDDAVVLTLDRGGDLRCGARWRASSEGLQLEKEMFYPDSLGDLYGRVAELLGFEARMDEHKVQWLSSDGDDRFVPLFEGMISWGSDDWPRIDRSWFDSSRLGRGGFADRVYEKLGVSAGAPVPAGLRGHVAAGVHRAVTRTVVRLAGDAPRICLAGGLGLNALLVAELERDREVFVQPASGNAGTAIGAVLHTAAFVYGEKRRVSLGDLCLGPEFSPEEIKKDLENCKLRFQYLLTSDEMIETAVRLLNDHQIVAWMQGRMEFGPRALGNRSILASPLNPYSTENLNSFIKHREPFRKFAASVPEELASEYFEVGRNARYLATVGRVRDAHRKTFDAAVLGDGYVRVHTVSKSDNPLYYRLLQEAGKRTGLPVLYNTSFNLFGDPLVCTPRDAARSFYSSGIDSMLVGHFLLRK